MIEVLSLERCTGCNICVRVCPTNVFDLRPKAAPTIARQADCQTCFQCEAYCPEQALFVAPARAPLPVESPLKDELWLVASGQLGAYRQRAGWNEADVPVVPSEDEFSALMNDVRRRLP